MGKLITFAVPCYNSAAYMRNCIDSLLTAGEEAQIVVVNDGSSDETGVIADEYAAKYPTTVEAVQKENGGHGSGVNAGLDRAQGLYFKVVDSDARLDSESLAKLLEKIRADAEWKSCLRAQEEETGKRPKQNYFCQWICGVSNFCEDGIDLWQR